MKLLMMVLLLQLPISVHAFTDWIPDGTGGLAKRGVRYALGLEKGLNVVGKLGKDEKKLAMFKVIYKVWHDNCSDAHSSSGPLSLEKCAKLKDEWWRLFLAMSKVETEEASAGVAQSREKSEFST